MYDLDVIAVVQQTFTMEALRHDLAIYFDGDSAIGQALGFE